MSVTVGLLFIGLLIFLGSALIPVDDRPKTWFDGSSVIIAIGCYIVGGGMSTVCWLQLARHYRYGLGDTLGSAAIAALGIGIVFDAMFHSSWGSFAPARYVRQPHFRSAPDAVNREVGAK